jgi:hypothetical protein
LRSRVRARQRLPKHESNSEPGQVLRRVPTSWDLGDPIKLVKPPPCSLSHLHTAIVSHRTRSPCF